MENNSEIIKEVVITRTFDAPRELVWKAWTDEVMIKEWFGPTGFTIPVSQLDVRSGGALRIVMRGPAGTPFDINLPHRHV